MAFSILCFILDIKCILYNMTHVWFNLLDFDGGLFDEFDFTDRTICR
jgi:hypothetical protein